MKYNLKIGKIYRVQMRNWKNIPERTNKRIFVGTENRFGSIPCYIFTSVLRKLKVPLSEISCPEYDLVKVEETL